MTGAPFKAGEKKEVAGKASWGDEQKAQTQASPDDAAPAEDQPAEEAAEEVAPEPEYKSFQDFLAEKEAVRVKASLEKRKPNEGADESQWKNTTLVKKNESDEVFYDNKEKSKEKKEKQSKQTLDIEQRFTPVQRDSDRPPRGNRANGPKSFGKAENRSGPKVSKTVNVGDENLFPSLS